MLSADKNKPEKAPSLGSGVRLTGSGEVSPPPLTELCGRQQANQKAYSLPLSPFEPRFGRARGSAAGTWSDKSCRNVPNAPSRSVDHEFLLRVRRAGGIAGPDWSIEAPATTRSCHTSVPRIALLAARPWYCAIDLRSFGGEFPGVGRIVRRDVRTPTRHARLDAPCVFIFLRPSTAESQSLSSLSSSTRGLPRVRMCGEQTAGLSLGCPIVLSVALRGFEARGAHEPHGRPPVSVSSPWLLCWSRSAAKLDDDWVQSSLCGVGGIARGFLNALGGRR